ncbi:hypothetical protein X953_00300 [Virgibacillus sp. SK37]|nr:hypothetical protein X953_00300 [Virgibacillus sp. SK37]
MRFRRTLSAGMASAASSATLRPGSSPHAIPAGVAGQQDVGHAIVAAGRGVLRLPPSTPINLYTAHSGCMRTQFLFLDLIVNSSEGEIWRLLREERPR